MYKPTNYTIPTSLAGKSTRPTNVSRPTTLISIRKHRHRMRVQWMAVLTLWHNYPMTTCLPALDDGHQKKGQDGYGKLSMIEARDETTEKAPLHFLAIIPLPLHATSQHSITGKSQQLKSNQSEPPQRHLAPCIQHSSWILKFSRLVSTSYLYLIVSSTTLTCSSQILFIGSTLAWAAQRHSTFSFGYRRLSVLSNCNSRPLLVSRLVLVGWLVGL